MFMPKKFSINGQEYSSENWKPISDLPVDEEIVVLGKFQGKFFGAEMIISEDGTRQIVSDNVDRGETEAEVQEWNDGVLLGELVYWQPAVNSQNPQCEVVDEVIKAIKSSIMEFSCRVGMHPNYLLLSEDVLGCLVNCFENTEVIFLDRAGKGEDLEGSTMVKVMGLPVRVVVGEGTVVPAIL